VSIDIERREMSWYLNSVQRRSLLYRASPRASKRLQSKTKMFATLPGI
jgi:hypothetical protein